MLDTCRLTAGYRSSEGTRTHLCASPVEQATDRGEDDADDEEKRQHGLGGQDGPVAQRSTRGLLVVCRGRCCVAGDFETYCHAFNRCCLKAVSIEQKTGSARGSFGRIAKHQSALATTDWQGDGSSSSPGPSGQIRRSASRHGRRLADRPPFLFARVGKGASKCYRSRMWEGG